MTSPNYIQEQFRADANQLFGGQLSRIGFVEGGIPLPSTPGYFPVHGISLNGLAAKASPTARRFTGGKSTVSSVSAVAYARTAKVALNTLTDGVSFLRVGKKKYIFVAASPVGDQILIGVSVNATATNIAAKLTTDAATIGIATAVASTDTVTITGLSDGTNFICYTDDPTKIIVTVTVTGSAAVAAVTAAKAVATLKFQGTRHSTGTINETLIVLIINNQPIECRFQSTVQTDDDTNSDLADMHYLTFDAAFAQSPMPIGSRVLANGAVTAADIAAGLVAFFGSIQAFSLSGDTITITVPTAGAAGNNIALQTQVLPSLPSPLISVDPKGKAQGDFLLRDGGAQDGFNLVLAPVTQDVNASNFKGRFTRITTGYTAEVKFKLFQDLETLYQKLAINSSQVSNDAFNDLLLFGGTSVPEEFGLILTTQSKQVVGAYDTLVFYSSLAGSTTINRAKNQVQGLDISFSANSFDRDVDSFGYLSQVRSL